MPVVVVLEALLTTQIIQVAELVVAETVVQTEFTEALELLTAVVVVVVVTLATRLMALPQEVDLVDPVWLLFATHLQELSQLVQD